MRSNVVGVVVQGRGSGGGLLPDADNCCGTPFMDAEIQTSEDDASYVSQGSDFDADAEAA